MGRRIVSGGLGARSATRRRQRPGPSARTRVGLPPPRASPRSAGGRGRRGREGCGVHRRPLVAPPARRRARSTKGPLGESPLEAAAELLPEWDGVEVTDYSVGFESDSFLRTPLGKAFSVTDDALGESGGAPFNATSSISSVPSSDATRAVSASWRLMWWLGTWPSSGHTARSTSESGPASPRRGNRIGMQPRRRAPTRTDRPVPAAAARPM